MYRAVIFDLDGTLVDSLDDIAHALNGALADEGLAVATRTEIAGWIGDGARVLVERAVAATIGDVPAHDPRLEAVVRRFGERYREAPIALTHVYEGIPEVLDRLDRAGVTLAVLSNKPHDLTVTVVERLLPGRFAVVHGQRRGTPLKPSPEAGFAIAAELGVAPDQCALVGDSAVDVATAHAAGMTPIAVSWGLRPRDELVAAGPMYLVDAVPDLIGFLL